MPRKDKRKRKVASKPSASTPRVAPVGPCVVPAAPCVERLQAFDLRVELTALELASGDDGLLRGMPEPVVLLVSFLITSGHARPLGRVLVRLNQPKGRFPNVVKPPAPAVLTGRGRAPEGARIAVLGIAVEEDSGTDIERLYARVVDVKGLRVWAVDDAVPAPAMIAELGLSAPSQAPLPLRVGVLDEGVDLHDLCTQDDFIGASLLVLPTTRSEDGFRLHFVGADGTNDWTAIVAVTIE